MGTLFRRVTLLAQIKPVHIQKIYNELLEREISAKTISTIQGVLYNIFEFAVMNDLLIKNPCKGIRKPKKEETDRRVLSAEEAHTLLSYLKKEQWKRFEPLIVTLLGTGMRIGEALGLQWSDLDFENREIHITHTLVYVRDIGTGRYMFKFQTAKTKNSTRTIPMLSEVYNALKHQRTVLKRLQLYMGGEWQPLEGFENLVFPNLKGRPCQDCDIRNPLNKIVAEINEDEKSLAEKEHREPFIMEHVHPHALRHTFATRCFEADMPPKTVQHLLGHASLQMTMDLYTHLMEDKKKSDMERLEGMLNASNY